MSSLASHFGRPIGCFTDIFSGSPEEKARTIVEAGFDCVQFASWLPTEQLTPDRMKEEIAPFHDAGLRIVAVSGYQNIIAPDPAAKRAALERLNRLFFVATLCGEGIGVATETGTRNTGSPWEFSEENLAPSSWAEMEDAVAELSAAALSAGSLLLIEGYVNNVVRTADDFRRLAQKVPGLGAVLDPFNLILEERLAGQAGETRRIVEIVGPSAKVAHAKDLIYHDGKIATPRAGTGIFDYSVYFQLLDTELPGLPLVIEHVEPKDIADSLDYLKRAYEKSLTIPA